MLSRLLPLALLLSVAAQASAEVTRVDISTRAAVGKSGYEKIVGTVHFAVDPAHPRNRVVADLDKAASGRVEFSADLYILRPLDASRSNGLALVEVVNRGRKLMLGGFNRGGTEDPVSEADLGDQFLLRRGFTLVWVGWQFDVPAGPLVGIEVPRARGVVGTARATVILNQPAVEAVVADLIAYPPADPAAGDSTLTVRDGPFGTPEIIARDTWRIQGNNVTLDSGFEPGRVYEVAYRTSDVPVGGAGLIAVRDVSSWIKYRDDAPVRARQAIAFGSSQSGRFLRSFLYQGFNADEQDRQVFDGVMAHIAGAGRLSLNERGSIPNTLGMYSATFFPYSDASQRDPASGREEGLLENERAGRHRPKIFYTNSGVEYWGGGRAAALVHTTLDGHRDLILPDNVRFYLFSGTQHSPAPFPPQMTTGQQPANPIEYWWSMRALLVAMERWVGEDAPPPASRHPRLADATLVTADRISFPAIPGVQSPRRIEPGRDGSVRLPLLVSQVDADGNELGGIRAPEVAVPLATYTGWNFRSRETGAPDQLVALLGSAIPFPKTKADRDASGDPRRSIEERYGSRAAYLAEIRKVAEGLVSGGYFLAEDVDDVEERAGEQWDLVAGR